jgi:AhpD family alkylhydroperoxidase
MLGSPVHTVASAPAAARPQLLALQQELGLVPNLAASMAESPALLAGFLHLRKLLEQGSFTPAEAQVLALTNAFENGCHYCIALHSAFALRAGVSAASVEELRQGRPPVEPRLRALSELSRQMVRRRGVVDPETLGDLLRAGFTRAQALEVIVGVASSVMANYAHHLTDCPLDEAFAAHAWNDAAA